MIENENNYLVIRKTVRPKFFYCKRPILSWQIKKAGKNNGVAKSIFHMAQIVPGVLPFVLKIIHLQQLLELIETKRVECFY